MMTRSLWVLVAAAVALSPALATAAEPEADQHAVDQIGPARRTLAITTAVVPGVLVHGTGHFVAGDSETGWDLVLTELVGIGGLGTGIVSLALTGASRDTVAVSTWVTTVGGGLFLQSWLADIYGVASPDDGFGLPVVEADWLEASAGYQWVDNPTFEFNHFQYLGLRGQFKRVGVGAQGWIAYDAANWRLRVDGRWRFVGPLPDRRARDGSYLDLRAGLVHHDYGDEGFSETTGELSVAGRLDLRRFSKTLNGSFAEMSLGLAAGAYSYDSVGSEATDLLLAEFGYGVYLGHSSGGWGEAAFFYSHRHDGFAGGMKMSGVGSGILGSFGLRVSKSIVDRLGLEGRVQAGSAYVGQLNLVYRLGGER